MFYKMCCVFLHAISMLLTHFPSADIKKILNRTENDTKFGKI